MATGPECSGPQHVDSAEHCTRARSPLRYDDRLSYDVLGVHRRHRCAVAAGGPADCRALARFKLTGIPPLPAGLARLEVTFTVDADGILRVSAREETTGIAAAVDVKPTYGLTDEEVERMLLDSFAHADADVGARQLAEQRIEAERILAAARAAVAANP